MPKGLKTCQLCGQENKARASACIHCAHPFRKQTTSETVAAEIAPVTPEPEAPKPEIRRFGGHIVVPAGKPPCGPKRTTDFTEDEIIEWTYEVFSKGNEKGLDYAPEAVKYWARYFWELGSPDYKKVCAIIDRM